MYRVEAREDSSGRKNQRPQIEQGRLLNMKQCSGSTPSSLPRSRYQGEGSLLTRRHCPQPAVSPQLHPLRWTTSREQRRSTSRERRSDWSGLCFFAGAQTATHSFTIVHQGRYRRALHEAERTGAYVNRSDFFETADLEIAPLEEAFAAHVAAAVEERQLRLKAHQAAVLGMQRVLQQSPFDHPKMSARTRMPLCFASTRETFRAFAAGWYAFVAAFREASEKFRNGALTVLFPIFSFRPNTPAT